MATSVKAFMGFVKDIPKPRKVFIEEGELTNWMLETSLNFGEQLIVTDPIINKWIGKTGQKDDAIGAEELAQLARGKYIKEIYHSVGHLRKYLGETLRELAMHKESHILEGQLMGDLVHMLVSIPPKYSGQCQLGYASDFSS